MEEGGYGFPHFFCVGVSFLLFLTPETGATSVLSRFTAKATYVLLRNIMSWDVKRKIWPTWTHLRILTLDSTTNSINNIILFSPELFKISNLHPASEIEHVLIPESPLSHRIRSSYIEFSNSHQACQVYWSLEFFHSRDSCNQYLTDTVRSYQHWPLPNGENWSIPASLERIAK